jgi:hypothetical protein
MSMVIETTDPRVEQRATSLAAALEEQRLAHLREEAAAQVAAEDAEAARLARLQDMAATVPERLKAAGVDVAEKKLRAAIDGYVVACVSYSDALHAVWAELSSLQPLPEGFAARASSGAVVLAGQQFHQIDPQGGILTVAREAILTRFPRMAVRLSLNR